MDWKNSIKDGLPQHQEEVYICVNGVNHVAHYNAFTNQFEVKETETSFPIHEEHPIIYWQELTSM